MMEPVKVGEPRILLPSRARLTVLSQCFRDPHGKKKDFLVLHAEVIPVSILPVTEDGSIIAIREFRYGISETILKLPGGNPEGKQTPEEAVALELLQETGFEAAGVERLRKEPIWVDAALMDFAFYPYLARGCRSIQEPRLDDEEFIEVLTVPVKEWIRMIFDEEIGDEKSITTTFLALPHLGVHVLPFS